MARRCDNIIDMKRVNSCVLKHLFLEGFEQPKYRQETPEIFFSTLLMSHFQKFADDAANKIALRAVFNNQASHGLN